MSATNAIYPSLGASRKPRLAPNQPDTGEMADDELLQRDTIDSRVAFAIAAFAAGCGLVALLERVGMPERLIGMTGLVGVLVGLGLIGVLLRTMRISRFYAAGRRVPPAYSGLAVATLGAALVIPFTPPVADRFSGAGVFAGFVGGLAFAALVSGPYLRKTGAFSISDLIASRFENQVLRLAIAAIVAASAFLAAIAGFDAAVSGLSTIAGLSRPVTATLIAAVLFLICAPGGQNGAVWTSAAAGAVLAVGFGLPLAVLSIRGDPGALRFAGGARPWLTAAERISAWQGDTGQPASLALSLGMALGMASCAPLLAPMAAVRNRIAAMRAGVGALIWGAAFGLLIAATVAASTLGLLDAMVGRRPDRLPDQIYAASATRLVAICDLSAASPAQARAACQRRPDFTGVIEPKDIQTRGLFLLTALPPLSSLGAAMSGLVWAAVVAAGLALAASGLLAAAVALGNDAIHHVRDRTALTSRRLAITRLTLVAGIAGCAVLISTRDVDPRIMIGLALATSAAGLAPLMALALWPRARAVDALMALVAGLCAGEAVLNTGPLGVERLAVAAVTGFACALAVGICSSLVGSGDRSAGHAFLAALLRPERDVYDPDKGA